MAGSSDFVSGNESILIDLSSWYKDSLSPKIELIQDAIDFEFETTASGALKAYPVCPKCGTRRF